MSKLTQKNNGKPFYKTLQEHGLSYATYWKRVRVLGMSHAEALTTPLRFSRKPSTKLSSAESEMRSAVLDSNTPFDVEEPKDVKLADLCRILPDKFKFVFRTGGFLYASVEKPVFKNGFFNIYGVTTAYEFICLGNLTLNCFVDRKPEHMITMLHNNYAEFKGCLCAFSDFIPVTEGFKDVELGEVTFDLFDSFISEDAVYPFKTASGLLYKYMRPVTTEDFKLYGVNSDDN